MSDTMSPPRHSSKLPSIEDQAGFDDRSFEMKLRGVGLRPTRQRVSLGRLIFAQGQRHITADILYDEARCASIPVSLATVYNTLHQFTEAGLLRRVMTDCCKLYYDTNSAEHCHFLFEDQDRLLDVSWSQVTIDKTPIPQDYEVVRVDVLIRLRNKNA